MATINGTYFSEALGMNTAITIITPKRQQIPTNELRIVYLLHGLMENVTDWQDKSVAAYYADVYQIAFIIPEVQRSFYTDMYYGLNYYSYISKELPKIISSLYNFNTSRENSYAIGLSMGGYGALKLGFKNPELFSGICAFSSACDIKNIVQNYQYGNYHKEFSSVFGPNNEIIEENDLYNLAKECNSNPNKPRIYMACGTNDFIYNMNIEFKSFMETLNYDYTFSQWDGIHDWKFFNEALIKALIFLFEPQKSSSEK